MLAIIFSKQKYSESSYISQTNYIEKPNWLMETFSNQLIEIPKRSADILSKLIHRPNLIRDTLFKQTIFRGEIY